MPWGLKQKVDHYTQRARNHREKFDKLVIAKRGQTLIAKYHLRQEKEILQHIAHLLKESEKGRDRRRRNPPSYEAPQQAPWEVSEPQEEAERIPRKRLRRAKAENPNLARPGNTSARKEK